jgi:hypothetical protein
MVGCCPHPEGARRRDRTANSNGRTRVSKDEDERGTPLCFETHRRAVLAGEGRALARAAALLNMRAGEQRSRRSRAADRCVGKTNLRVCRARSHCFGIVFTMKIATQSCKPSTRGAGTRSSGISRCKRGLGGARAPDFLLLFTGSAVAASRECKTRLRPAPLPSWPSARAEILWCRLPVRSRHARIYGVELSPARRRPSRSKDPAAVEVCCP